MQYGLMIPEINSALQVSKQWNAVNYHTKLGYLIWITSFRYKLPYYHTRDPFKYNFLRIAQSKHLIAPPWGSTMRQHGYRVVTTAWTKRKGYCKSTINDTNCLPGVVEICIRILQTYQTIHKKISMAWCLSHNRYVWCRGYGVRQWKV